MKRESHKNLNKGGKKKAMKTLIKEGRRKPLKKGKRDSHKNLNKGGEERKHKKGKRKSHKNLSKEGKRESKTVIKKGRSHQALTRSNDKCLKVGRHVRRVQTDQILAEPSSRGVQVQHIWCVGLVRIPIQRPTQT